MKEQILLASILHDVGKFWQRTGERHSEGYDKYDEKDYGKNGAHAKWSADFVKNILGIEEIESLILYHHNPSKCEFREKCEIIKRADELSAGEREEKDILEFLDEIKSEIKKEHTDIAAKIRDYLYEEIINKPFFKILPDRAKKPFNEVFYELKEKRHVSLEDVKRYEVKLRGDSRFESLRSIFRDINTGKGDTPVKKGEEWYHDLSALELNEKIFPSQKYPKLRYEKLWKDFKEEMKKSPKDLSTYYYILQKYTCFVPSAAYVHVPDVSLFDHLKTTCAIASCLFETDEKEEFLLIGGDISGVQKFIYSITSKGAAKGLRGRSFYLELLSESIAKYILRELNLPITNLLYCGGGHFYILAPNAVEGDLRGIQREIAERLLEIHRGELYLVLEWISLTADDFQKERFGIKWSEIGDKIALKKKRKFSEILEMHEKIFGPIDKGGTRCDVCGSEEKVKEEEERMICNFCKRLETLARDIARANYWIEAWKKDIKISDKERGSWKEALSKFGVEYEFREIMEGDLKMKDAEHIFVYKLNDTNFSDVISGYKDAKSPISFGFKFLAKNTPWVQKEKIKDMEGKVYTSEEIKDFRNLAKDSEEGIKNWGVLRADIDNLGKIFAEGLGEERTISRVSNLSSMLSQFFRGWLERICENDEYKDRVYAIYSGGDDLFIVGAWDKMPEIGKKIYEDFRAFTCRNLNITLSAGVMIAPSEKYPLYQVANLAGEALDKSKGLRDKDRITFLDMPMKWDKFGGEVTGLKENLKKLLDAGVSRALLQKLNEIYDEYRRQWLKHGETLARYDDRYGRWRWLLAYMIARVKVSKENKELLKETEELIRKNIEYLPIAVRWVEYLTRKE